MRTQEAWRHRSKYASRADGTRRALLCTANECTGRSHPQPQVPSSHPATPVFVARSLLHALEDLLLFSPSLPCKRPSPTHHRHRSLKRLRGRAARAAGGGSAPIHPAPCTAQNAQLIQGGKASKFRKRVAIAPHCSRKRLPALPCSAPHCSRKRLPRPALLSRCAARTAACSHPAPRPAHCSSELDRRTNSAPLMERSARRAACRKTN